MKVTIDGPAGAGKSTVAKELSKRLGFRFLDTGAMYRAVVLAAIDRDLNWDRPEELARLAGELTIELRDGKVLLDGVDVTDKIRTFAVTSVTYHAANNPGVREHLVEMQRQAAGDDDIVAEGRDQGTVVFPDAECKIFLTAGREERARRRQEDLNRRGETLDFELVLAEQDRRDQRDKNRAVGPLVKAPDAIEVNTDGLSPGQVVDRLEELAREKMRGR